MSNVDSGFWFPFIIFREGECSFELCSFIASGAKPIRTRTRHFDFVLLELPVLVQTLGPVYGRSYSKFLAADFFSASYQRKHIQFSELSEGGGETFLSCLYTALRKVMFLH